jgi:hypothetical protein
MITSFDRNNYPVGYLAREHSESEVQRDIIKALRQAGITVNHHDSGAKAMRSRAGAGGPGAGDAGFPDISGFIPAYKWFAKNSGFPVPLYIEVKRPAYITQCFETGRIRIFKRAGTPTQAQLEFIQYAHVMRCAAGFAWSVSDALEIAGVK